MYLLDPTIFEAPRLPDGSRIGAARRRHQPRRRQSIMKRRVHYQPQRINLVKLKKIVTNPVPSFVKYSSRPDFFPAPQKPPEKKKKSTVVLPAIEKQGSYSKIHIYHRHRYPSQQDVLFHSEESQFQYPDTFESPSRNLSGMMEQRIITHLRKRLNRRIEKRMHALIAEEEDESSSTGSIDAHSSDTRELQNATRLSYAHEHDLMSTYNDRGERVDRNPADDRQPTQTDINLKSAMKKSTSRPSLGRRQVSMAETPDGLKKRHSSRDDDDVDVEIEQAMENNNVDLTNFKELPVSPVPTPMVYRPATRESNRLSYDDSVARILSGSLNVKCPADARVLRMYVSSAFTDSDVERGYLLQKVYPALKSYCIQRGYEFHVLDLHWANRDWINDDHTVLECSQKILDKCMDGARTVSFLNFLGQKFGPEMVPTTIPAEEFDAILAAVRKAAAAETMRITEKAAAMLEEKRKEITSAELEDGNQKAADDTPPPPPPPLEKVVSKLKLPSTEKRSLSPAGAKLKRKFGAMKQAGTIIKLALNGMKGVSGTLSKELDDNLLTTWYKLDENVVPAVYRLQKISNQIKDFARNDESKKALGKNAWMATQKQLLGMLQRFSQETLKDESAMKKYFKTVIDVELENGLFLADTPDDNCYVIRRTIPDLQGSFQDSLARDYIDIDTNSGRLDSAMVERMGDMWAKIKAKVPFRNMRDYEIQWTPKGIDPNLRPHALYLDKMCTDFLEVMTARLNLVIQEDKQRRNDNVVLFEEVAEHVKFVHERARHFQGRKELLNIIKQYLRSTYRMPLIIHGKSGSGKTSLLAKAAKETNKWFKKTGRATIVRFIGVTSSSTNIRELLYNISKQICYMYGTNASTIPQDYKGLMNDFSERLKSATAEEPLIIYIDSLNQLSDENDARHLAWLPKELPEHVHIVLSTLPDTRYESFPALKKAFADNPDSFIDVPPMSEADAVVMLDHWLKKANRTLTYQQYDVILDAFKQCPYPLQLKVSFDESLKWCSFTAEEKIKLQPEIKKAITMLFARMEVTHGEPLVRRALGYITAARNGITENEMLDLLSLDDAVMDDITNQLKPRIRRCPMLSWTRLKEDLSDYLVERSADGCKPLRWFQSQFQEAAEDRYLKSKDKAPSYHKAIAEYFMGTWQDGKPIGTSEKLVDRFISEQPLYWEHASLEGVTQRVFNHRKLSELPCNLLKAQLFNEMKKEALCNFEFILAKVCGQSLRAIMEDYQMALAVEPNDIDLKLVSDTLYLSTNALSKDPRQLATQITSRMNDLILNDKPTAPGDPKKYPCLHQLYWDARRASVPSIIPSMTCMTPPGGILFDLLSGHKETLTAVASTCGGSQALTTSMDDTLKQWDMRTGKVKNTINGVGKQVLSIRSARQNSLVITSETSCIRIWDLKSGECKKTIDEYIDPASITTAKDESHLVAFFDGTNIMRTWRLEGDFGKVVETQLVNHESVCHKDNSITVGQTSNGELVLYAFRSSTTAFVYNAVNGEQVRVLQPPNKGASITSVALSRDYYVLGCRYQQNNGLLYQLELFDVTNGKHVRSIRGCATDYIDELVVNQSGSHAICVSASDETNTSDIAIWNLETEDHKHLATHANVSTMCACLDLRYTLTGSPNENALRIWNLSSSVNQSGVRAPTKTGVKKMYVMAKHPQYIVTQSYGSGNVCVWNMSRNHFSGFQIRKERGVVMSEQDVLLFRNTKAIILADRGISTVTEDEQQVYQTLYVYDLVARKYERKIKDCFIYPSPAHEYAALSDDRLLGLSENRSHFIAWSMKNGHILYRIRPNFRELERRRIEMGIADNDDDNERILNRKRGTTAKMTPWDRRSESDSARRLRRQAERDDNKRIVDELKKEKENAIDQYMMSGDEKIIVASFFAHHLCVFDVETQKHTQTLENENSMMSLYVAALTYDGGYFVHTNYDEESKVSYVTLWNCKTGEVKRRLKNEKNVSAITINSTGRRIVFGKDKNEMRVWEPLVNGSLRKVKGYKNMRFNAESKIVLLNDGSQAAVFAGDISLWDIDSGVLLSVFTPDIKIQCFDTAFDGQLLVFGLRDSPNLVSLRLSKKHRLPIAVDGPDMFDEAPESSDESEDEDYA